MNLFSVAIKTTSKRVILCVQELRFGGYLSAVQTYTRLCVLEIIKAELCGQTDALVRLKAQWSFPLECRVGKRTERKPLHQNTAKQKYKKS